jgi:hypothetical protein
MLSYSSDVSVEMRTSEYRCIFLILTFLMHIPLMCFLQSSQNTQLFLYLYQSSAVLIYDVIQMNQFRDTAAV